jgi:hypothetical protein
MRTREKVSHMLVEATEEMMLHDEMQKRKQEVPFHGFGKDGLYHKHNCITWAVEKLKLADIFAGKSIYGPIITVPTLYTESLSHYEKIPAVVQI